MQVPVVGGGEGGSANRENGADALEQRVDAERFGEDPAWPL